MNEVITKKLDNAIEESLDNLGSITDGNGREQEIENIVKLHKASLEAQKLEQDYDEKLDRRTIDIDRQNREDRLKHDQLIQQKREGWLRFGAEIGIFAVGCVFHNYQANKGFRFEEAGTIASQTSRRVIDSAMKFFGRKK